MTYDFRCEKCGKMLKLRNDPGRRCRCPNCRGWTRVPQLLGELPHPCVPPDIDAADDAEAGHGATIVVTEEPEPATAVALGAIGATVPWIFSAITHMGFFLILLFIVMLVSKPAAKFDSGGPISITPVEPIGNPYDRHNGGARPDVARRIPLKVRHEPRETLISSGPDNRKVILGELRDGRGNALEGDSPRNGNGTGLFGLGTGDGESGRRGAANIVYVIDRSGSMAKIFEDVKIEMGRSFSQLFSTQRFHVVLFGEGETIEGPGRGLVDANLDNKFKAWKFIQEKDAHGATTALVALKRAFAVLSARPAGESKLIYLVSDGDFSGLSGGSEYRAPGGQVLSGNEAVLQWLADNNKSAKVQIHTVLLHSSDATAAQVLRQIAQSNGGRFKYVSPDE